MVQISPLVSIVVPNYNHEKYLKQRLESIFNQTYVHFEVILLDDCSSDTSPNILSEYAKNPKVSHCIFNEANSGNTFIQWNKGIALAKGDFIWIAESDDFCELNFLEELIKPVLQDSEISLVYCQSNRVDETSEIRGSWLSHTNTLDSELFLTNFVMEGNEFIERFLIHKNVIPNASGVLFQRVRAVELGELDIDSVLRTCGDWLFYIKLITNSKVAFNPKSLNNFRQHSTSVIAKLINSDNQITIINFELMVRKKMISFLSIFKAINYTTVLYINRKIEKEITYRKAIFYIKNDNKIKGGLILVTVLDVFFRKSTFVKNFRPKGSK
jgi:glycosyltransferase involved in cell wall biosynthesis